jgi:hypothetical protein
LLRRGDAMEFVRLNGMVFVRLADIKLGYVFKSVLFFPPIDFHDLRPPNVALHDDWR